MQAGRSLQGENPGRDPALRAGLVLRLYKLIRLVIHLLVGLYITLLRFPRLGGRERRQLTRRWSRQLLRILGVRLRLIGRRQLPGRCLIVANHISWLDIFLIQACQPAVFVAKAEIRAWPLIGTLCRCAGTIFLERGSRASARKANAALASAMDAGLTAGIFPEGRTTMGRHVAPFHRALFQSAIDAGALVQPALIRYLDRQDRFSEAAAYVGETSLIESLSQILSTRTIVAELRFLDAISPSGESRQSLAYCSHAVITEALLQHRAPEPGIPADPPAAVR